MLSSVHNMTLEDWRREREDQRKGNKLVLKDWRREREDQRKEEEKKIDEEFAEKLQAAEAAHRRKQ